jgi:signal recognition particle subunit SRP54
MGGLTKIISMLPGANTNQVKEEDIEKGEREFVIMEAIINSMTKEERNNPSVLNGSRRKRIAAGSGQPVSKVNNTIKKYEESKKMMKKFTKPGAKLPKMFR